MFTRCIILILIAVLALPLATLTRPAETAPVPWSDVAVAAKGKKPKKGKKKVKSAPSTVRQTVTQNFSSAAPITIPNGAPSETEGAANPYPATIDVAGFVNGAITDVNLVLHGFTHTTPRDLDLLLTAGAGRRALVLSDVGAGSIGQEDAVVNLELTLDDEAATPLPPVEPLTNGTFQPANYQPPADSDPFAVPAPAPDGNSALSAFDGANPNDAWQLWVIDDAAGDHGVIADWSLEITAETDVQVDEPPPGKDKKQKKKGKKRR